MVEQKFNIGDKLRDRVTGLEGIVMVVAHYHTGCIHYAISPKLKKGEVDLPEWQWLDQSRFDLVKKNVVSFDVDSKNPSGNFPTPPSKKNQF